MKARYIRTSSGSQNQARQLAKQHPDEKIFIDVVSGSVHFADREQGKALINAIQSKEITYLSVSSVDRLGRGTFDIQNTLNWLTEQGVNVHVDNLGIDSLDKKGKPNPMFKMIVDVLANVANMERESILERQQEGIRIAKAQGKYKGRVLGSAESPEQKLSKHKDIVKYLKEGRLTLEEIGKQTGKSLSTVKRINKVWQDNNVK